MTSILAEITSDAVLDAAYSWLCHRRRGYPADADVWSFRRDWPEQKRRIQADLSAGRYRFGLLDRITLASGDVVSWLTVGYQSIKAALTDPVESLRYE